MAAKEITKHELIGLELTIVASNNPNLVGITGKVVDETKNMITLEDEKGKLKKVPKSQVTFKIKFQGQTLLVEGKELAKRPEDRLKGK